MRHAFFLSLWLLLITCSFSAFAGSGTTGAAFLDIPVGAGPAAMGGAYTALATNAYGSVWNPGALAWSHVPEVAAQLLSYFKAVNYEYVSLAYPFGRPGTLGV